MCCWILSQSCSSWSSETGRAHRATHFCQLSQQKSLTLAEFFFCFLYCLSVSSKVLLDTMCQFIFLLRTSLVLHTMRRVTVYFNSVVSKSSTRSEVWRSNYQHFDFSRRWIHPRWQKRSPAWLRDTAVRAEGRTQSAPNARARTHTHILLPSCICNLMMTFKQNVTFKRQCYFIELRVLLVYYPKNGWLPSQQR